MFWPYKKNRWHFIYRWVTKSAFKVCDSFLFITENEEKNVNEIKKGVKNMHLGRLARKKGCYEQEIDLLYLKKTLLN